VEVVRLKAAANLGIGHEQISKQVDGHLRPRVEVKRLTESIAGGLVRVNRHAEARPDIQSSLPRRHTWLEGQDGLIGGLRRVETVLVKLHVEVKTSVQPQDVFGALGIDLEGAFACTPVAAQPPHVDVRFVVECGAVFVVAFERGLSLCMGPNHSGSVHRSQCRVHGKAVKPVEQHLASPRTARQAHFFLANETRHPCIHAVVVEAPGQELGRARCCGVMEGCPPASVA